MTETERAAQIAAHRAAITHHLNQAVAARNRADTADAQVRAHAAQLAALIATRPAAQRLALEQAKGLVGSKATTAPAHAPGQLSTPRPGAA